MKFENIECGQRVRDIEVPRFGIGKVSCVSTGDQEDENYVEIDFDDVGFLSSYADYSNCFPLSVLELVEEPPITVCSNCRKKITDGLDDLHAGDVLESPNGYRNVVTEEDGAGNFRLGSATKYGTVAEYRAIGCRKV